MKANILLFILVIFSSTLFAQVKNISPRAAERKMKKELTVLDVRTPAEFDSSHIKGAINYDVLDSIQFMQHIQALDKNENYLVYCRSGKRSAKAAEWMEQQGFQNVYNMKEGILGWEKRQKKKNKN